MIIRNIFVSKIHYDDEIARVNQWQKIKLFLFITSLVQRYEIQNEKGKQLPSLDEIIGLTHTPKTIKRD